MRTDEFISLLSQAWPDLDPKICEQVGKFREMMVAENMIQNLTRLTTPEDFLSGHVLDVRAMLGMDEIRFPAADLGSGCGVPGLLAAIFREDPWVLVESEKRKAEFLERAVSCLGLSPRVRVYPGRIEDFLKRERVETVAARAVGPVERIYGWISRCSTWNNLVLFKGPRWTEEWATLTKGKWARSLKLVKEERYRVIDSKTGGSVERVIVLLTRVPRGT